jgi:predicted metal-dependent HD superfamily phosphohydrolase
VHDDEQIIRTAWRSVVAHGAASAAAGHVPGRRDAPLDAVLARHREPHRRYHTVTHVAWVVRTVDELVAEVTVPSVPVVHLAAVYHDAVYDPRAADNEARSADLAVAVGRELGWTDPDLDEVHRLIIATAGHESVTDDAAASVLLDADLAILGAEPSAYRAYVTGVRFEYAHVADPDWRVGRTAVLRSFLDRERIFATAPMRAARERRARANLSAEIAELSRGV